MRPTRTLLIVTLLATLPLAGCFGNEVEITDHSFTAGGGAVSTGWAYDGSGFVGTAATLKGSANNPANTANLTSTFTLDGEEWTATFDQVLGTKEFMDGGVAFDLVEHGDTGTADASIPRILAKVAVWGTAKLTRNGEPVLAPSGADTWSAHLMVSDTTVRGADGRILKADGATPYDPSAPGDATRAEGDLQAFLVLKNPDGENAARADEPVTGNVAFTGPASTQRIEVAASKGSTLTLNITADGGDAPLGVGSFSYRLLDADGNELSTGGGDVMPNAPLKASFSAPNLPGPVTLELTGQGAFTAKVEGTLAHGDHNMLVITWDDVTLE